MTKKRTLPEELRKKQLKKNDPRTNEISKMGGLANAKRHAEAKSLSSVTNALSAYLSNKLSKEEAEYLVKAGFDVKPDTTKSAFFAISVYKLALCDPKVAPFLFDKISKDQQCSYLYIKISSIHVDIEKLMKIDYNKNIDVVEKEINDIYDDAIYRVEKAFVEEFIYDKNQPESNFKASQYMTVAEITKLETFKNNKIAEWNTQRRERLELFRAQKDALSKHNQTYFDEDGVDENASKANDINETPSFVQEGVDNNVIKEDDVNLKNDSVIDI